MIESSLALPVDQRRARFFLGVPSAATPSGSRRSRSTWSTRAFSMKVEMLPRRNQTPSAPSLASSTSIFAPPTRYIHTVWTSSTFGASSAGLTTDASLAALTSFASFPADFTTSRTRDLSTRFVTPPRLYQTPCESSQASSTSTVVPSFIFNWSAEADADSDRRMTRSSGPVVRSRSDLERVRIGQVPRVLPRLFLREAVRGAEVVAPGRVDEAHGDLGRARLEEADVGHVVEQVARLARLHLAVFVHVAIKYVVDAVLLDSQAARVGGALENFDVGG